MPSAFKTISCRNLHIFFRFFVGSDDNALFSTDEEFIGSGFRIKLEHTSSDDSLFAVDLVSQEKCIDRTLGELSGVPPQNPAIRRGGDEFSASFHGQPREVGYRIAVRLLHWRHHCRLGRVAFHVPDCN